jgi:hypothetical protein
MNSRDSYQKAVDIADMLLARGFPVIQVESLDDHIIIRFGGDRKQEIHADAGGASLEGFVEAYGKPPP